jgi:hypothetical protein
VGYAIGFLQDRLPPDTPPSQEDEAALIDHLTRNFDLGSSAPTIASEAVSRCRAIIGHRIPPID